MMGETRTRAVSPVILLLLGLALAGCGGNDDDSSARNGDTLEVTLGEYSVTLARDEVDAGEVTFEVKNAGAKKHEMYVVRANSAESLPTNTDGAFDEDAYGKDEVLGEAGHIEPGRSTELTLDLEPGAYVLLCNIVEKEDDGALEAHFEKGMHVVLTVG